MWTTTVPTAKLSWAPTSVCRTRLDLEGAMCCRKAFPPLIQPCPWWGLHLGGLISPGAPPLCLLLGGNITEVTHLQTPEVAAWSRAQDMQRHSPWVLVQGFSAYLWPQVIPSNCDHCPVRVSPGDLPLAGSFSCLCGPFSWSQAEKPQICLIFEPVLTPVWLNQPLVPTICPHFWWQKSCLID